MRNIFSHIMINCMKEEQKLKYGECRACRSKIVWLKTTNDRSIPVEPQGVAPGTIFFDYHKHTSHFATCTRREVFKRAANVRKLQETPAEIAKEREEIQRKNREKIDNDLRPFIKNQKNKPISMYRYVILNRAEAAGLEYEKLISYSNQDILDWLVDHEKAETDIQGALFS